MEDKVFTAKEVARMLKLSERWVKRLSTTGRLPRLAAGSKDFKFRASTIKRFVLTNGMSMPVELEEENEASKSVKS